MVKYIVSWEVDDGWGDALGNQKDYWICEGLRYARIVAKQVQSKFPNASKITISKFGQIII